jgi:hypothetical protein
MTTYRETFEIAMFVVKRNENATSTRLSCVVKVLSLNWPLRRRM